MFWALWSVFLKAMDKTNLNLSINNILSYYLVCFMLYRLANFNTIVDDIEENVVTGNMAIYYIRPVAYPVTIIGRILAQFSINFIIIVPILFFILIMFCNLTLSIKSISLFFIFAMFSLSLRFTISLIIGLFSFWFERVWSLRLILDFIIELASGGLLPLYIFPKYIADIFSLLPFQYIIYVPTQILLGKVSNNHILLYFMGLFIWCGILIILANLMWNVWRKKFMGYGV